MTDKLTDLPERNLNKVKTALARAEYLAIIVVRFYVLNFEKGKDQVLIPVRDANLLG